ncbi:peptidyl-alpha-hydroxyglycine alpha-amidating lyase family protein [Sphingomonas sp. 3P27F8]|uniref:peptidyl-alpha-hydroxyglycine alpha-amidating lyase family protein n=1 Tax=Sphingomonas sp. 3P27F8 TaxID=2502213 RepID=UPI0010F6FD7B|nr:peptidyl-alpha-hydroxyglycine alpha-amidating lyase family protein [Sphingomonas sp. 3P27F8]
MIDIRKALLAVVALPLIATATAARPSPDQPVPEIKFDSVDFLQMPSGMNLGEVAGVAVNKAGHVFVFHRGNTSGPAYSAAAAQLLEFDASGKFIREIGKNLYAWSFAHAVRIDPFGNIWTADKGSDTVVKFDPSGKVKMVIGRKIEATSVQSKTYERADPPLPPIDGYFRQVTDMAWDSKGNTYISDGYVNSRVAKVAPDGRWLKSWGSFGSQPGQFNQPHSIAVDAQDRVYVADRGNRRIQVFDTEGKLLNIITIRVPFPDDAPVAIGNRPTDASPGYMLPGAPWAICITPKSAGPQTLFVADAWPGRIYKLSLDGKVLGWLGGAGKQLKQFGWAHELACPTENQLFVAEVLNWRVQKLTLRTR